MRHWLNSHRVLQKQLPTSLHSNKNARYTHVAQVKDTALYSDGTTHIKQHRSKGFNQMAPPAANNHCITRYGQSFRHNKHTYTDQKTATNHVPGTISKLIANYKGRKSCTAYGNHTSSQRQLKTGVTQGGVLSRTLFNIYTVICHHPEHRFRSWPTQMTSPSHLHTQARYSQEIHTTIPT